MKKTVKRQNGRKSVKKNAKKRVSTRKNKQRGGMNILVLFVCTCLTIIAVLYYNHVPTMEFESYQEILKKNPVNTEFLNCLSNKDGADPFTTCYRETRIENIDQMILEGFGKCVRETAKEIDNNVSTGIYRLKTGDDSIDNAGSVCLQKGLQKYIKDKKLNDAEKCANNLATSVNIDNKCFPNVIKFFNEQKVMINKDKNKINTNEITIYSADIPGHINPIDVIGTPELGFFSTELVKMTDLKMTHQQIIKIFNEAQKAVNKDLSEYAQKVYFIDNGENTIVRYADSNNPNGPVLEFINMNENTVGKLRDAHLAQLP